jgi:hypothetical protein
MPSVVIQEKDSASSDDHIEYHEETEHDSEDEKEDGKAASPILHSPKKHVARFDEKDWPKVAKILIDAQKDKPKNWKLYAKKIDGGTGHGKSTLVYWYQNLLINPCWRPTRKACGEKNKILCAEAEDAIWQRIYIDFISERLLFTDEQCQAIALEVVHSLPPQFQPKREFRASLHWVARFRANNMVSLRTPHLRRRADCNLASITHFVTKLREAMRSGRNKRFIVNADETNWPVIFAKKKTWAVTGKKKAKHTDVVAKVNGDKKTSFTVMAAITANGDTLPLFMIAKGKTPLCERQLEAKDDNKVYHSAS